MDKIRVGVVGAGILGDHHARACAANHLAQLVGVADNREKAARALASQLGCEAYGSAQALYQAQKPDTVIIATPDAFHREPFLAALDAGVKSIICEKPLATTVAESEEMAQAARQAGARIFINFANRFAHLFMATYRVVRGGLIGRPVYGDTYLDDNISVPLRLWGDRSREWASTSSTAFFLFPHMLDLLHWIYAPARIEAVQAMKQNVVLGFTPDLYEAFFHWDNGLKTHVKAEWVKHIEGLVEFSLSLGGAEGSVIARRVAGYHSTEAWRAMLDAGIPAERVDDIVRELIASGVPVRGHMIPDPTCNGERERGYLELDKFGSLTDDDLFLQAIAENTDTPTNWQGFGSLPSTEDGMEAALVVDAVITAAETGETVKISRNK